MITLITGQTLGSLRNDYTGRVGFLFTPSTAITISALGRWIFSGNSQSHTVVLINNANSSILGSVTLATSGQTAGAYSYVNLSSPITLTAGVSYSIASSETSGGDQWGDTASISTIAGLSGVGSANSDNSGTTLTFEFGNSSYVPVNAILLTTMPSVSMYGVGHSIASTASNSLF